MSAWWLVLLMPLAFAGTLWWRRRIESRHNAFRMKMDLAADEDHARQQLQKYYEKQDAALKERAGPDDSG
jgi:hypothetical protein